MNLLKPGSRLRQMGVRCGALAGSAFSVIGLHPSLWFKADSGTNSTTNGVAISAWADSSGNAGDLSQGTAGNRPTYVSATPAVRFDGTDDYLRRAAGIADTVGTLVVAFVTGATAFATRGDQSLFSSADEGAANEWFEVGVDSTGRIYLERNAAGTKMRLTGSSFLDVSTAYILTIIHNGTDYYVEVDGVEQNPLTVGDGQMLASNWFGDVTGADNFVLGGTVTSGGIVRPFLGDVLELILYPTDLT